MRDPIQEDSEATEFESSSFVPDNNIVDSKYARSDNRVSLLKLFDSLPSHSKSIRSKEYLIQFYDKIKGNYLITYDVKKHPKFAVLREATEILSPQFDTKELKNVFTAILPSKPIMDDKLGNIIVDALLKRVSYIPFDQILFVDFLMNKYYNISELSKNYNILRLTLQTMFLSKVEDELVKFKEFEDIMKIVAYCENNTQIIPMKIVNSLTTSLLLVEDEQFTVQGLISILIFASNFSKSNEHVRKLLRKTISLWYESPVTAYQVHALLRVLAFKSNAIDTEIFKDPEFIRHCVDIVIQHNGKRISFDIQNSFNIIVSSYHGLCS